MDEPTTAEKIRTAESAIRTSALTNVEKTALAKLLRPLTQHTRNDEGA